MEDLDKLSSQAAEDKGDLLDKQAAAETNGNQGIEGGGPTGGAAKASPTGASGPSGTNTAETRQSSAAGDAGVDSGSDDNPSSSDSAEGKTKLIRFSSNDFQSRVFYTSEGTKTITYTIEDDDIIPQYIIWNAIKNGDITTLANATFADGKIESGPFVSGSVSEKSIQLSLSGTQVKNYYREEMYLEIDWTTDDAVGFTKSGPFSVSSKVKDSETDLQEKLEASADDASASSLESSSAISATAEATASSDANDDDSSGGGGGGLSTGATAGIAVGAVIGGLLIIGALAWFLLRRRRRSKQVGDDYTSQQAYAVDKETHGRGADSPNSPYSDENQVQPVALHGVTHDRSEPAGGIPRTSTGSHGRAGTTGSQTPQGVSSNVAHLVEDGMTAEEIRRLEEEERQLDDEIERAGRR